MLIVLIFIYCNRYVYESVLLRKREKSTSLRRSRGSSLAVLPSARPPSPPPPQLDSSFSSPDNKSAAVRFAQPSNPFFVDVDSTLFQKAVNNVASALAAHVSQLALVALRLRVLPQRLVEIHTLLDLDLSANQLPDSAFSASFARLVRLKRLNLSTNLLTRVPAVLLQLQELTVLDMSSNAVTYIPDDLFKLEHLLVANFSSNAITQVPATITSNRIALQALNLDGNKIEKAVKPSVFSPSRFTLANNPATDTKIMRKELKDTST